MSPIPPSFHDFFEKKTIAHFVTLDAEGRPHTTPVWIDYDASSDRLVVNTERERRKERHVSRNPTVSVSMTDPDDAYRYLSVTGEVDHITTDGAREHIDVLTQRYFEEPEYPSPIETERICLFIRPDEVITSG